MEEHAEETAEGQAPAAAGPPAGEAAPRRASERAFRLEDLKWPFVVAVVETVIVGITDVTQWTALAVALVVLAFHFWRGRTLVRLSYRRVSWVAATSQALVVLAVIIAVLFGWFVLILAGALGAGALYLLVTDRPHSK